MSARTSRRRGKSRAEQTETETEIETETEAETEIVDVDADELFGDDRSSRSSRRNSAAHKDRQLCEQVFQILSYVMASLGDEVLRTLAVESVMPGVDSSRLLVTVIPMEAHPVEELLDRLARSRGALRSEIAAGIHRKRTPELSFRIASREELEP
jgi:ribosome-binding factor A